MRIALLMGVGIPWSRDAATMLARLGHEVHAIDFTTDKAALGHLLRSDPFQQEDIARFKNTIAAVHWLSSRMRNTLRYVTSAPALRRVLNTIRPDVLLTLYGGGFASLAQLSGFRPYCTWVVGSDVLLVRGLQARMLSRALRDAALVFANGDFLAARARQLSPRANVETLLFGIDLDEFATGTKPRGPCRILTNRGFNPVYQNDYIVRALQLVDPDVADFELVFASAGPELDAVRNLADRILPSRTRERVRFCGGVIRAEMLRLLHESHVFVSMARSDGTATSLLEAMASGSYPVLSDIPQNREWVRPEWGNGTLVPLDSPPDLAAALQRAIAAPPRDCAVAAFNRRQVQDRADARRNMERLVTRLHQVV